MTRFFVISDYLEGFEQRRYRESVRRMLSTADDRARRREFKSLLRHQKTSFVCHGKRSFLLLFPSTYVIIKLWRWIYGS